MVGCSMVVRWWCVCADIAQTVYLCVFELGLLYRPFCSRLLLPFDSLACWPGLCAVQLNAFFEMSKIKRCNVIYFMCYFWCCSSKLQLPSSLPTLSTIHRNIAVEASDGNKLRFIRSLFVGRMCVSARALARFSLLSSSSSSSFFPNST